MLDFDFNNIIKIYGQSHLEGISDSQIKPFLDKSIFYNESLKKKNLGFLDLPTVQPELNKILEFVKNTTSKYENIVILGIGGSMLGPQTILDVFSQKVIESGLKIYCLDNIDPDLIFQTTKKINLSKTLFLVQTKSGTTPETLAQYFYFEDLCNKQKLDIDQHFIFVTDPKAGYLRQFGKQSQVPTFSIPESVGGRFSVLSPVGLLIAGFIGLDLQKLLDGANSVLWENFYGQKTEILKLSTIQFLLSQKNKNITVLMPYSSRLKTLSNWYVQLLSESIGKQKITKDSQKTSVGITPLAALGATDQHSQLQLFKEGPSDKLIIFIQIVNHQVELLIPEIHDTNFDYLSQKSFNQLLEAEFLGTRQSLTESLKPNLTLVIDKVNEFSLGELFMTLQLSVAYLGELFEIDAFDQPGVERSKVLTKELLQKKS